MTIHYYKKNVWGNTLEYLVDPGQAKILFQLIGQKTINGRIRELLRDLTGGYIKFQEVIVPN